MSNFTKGYIMEEVPSRDFLLSADALLFAVYGWNTDKIKKMKLGSILYWIKLAKKRMTWGNAYKLQMLFEDKEVPKWKKFLKIKS